MLRLALAICFLVGLVRGATYHEGPYADGFDHTGPAEPEVAELIPEQPLPNDNDTLHEGLVYKGNGGPQVRGAAPLGTSDPNVQKDIVGMHNTYRRGVSTTASFEYGWDAAAAKLAQNWVDRCEYRHPTSSQTESEQYLKTAQYSCGQNIARGSGTPTLTWAGVGKMWYDEVKDFKLGQPTTKVVGHYTAMMWDKTFRVGCAYKKCGAGTAKEFDFFACNYCPAGNVSPRLYSPYELGKACAKCPNNCNNGLCTNPCPFTNALSNCETSSGSTGALFPTGCEKAPSYKDSLKPKCEATCKCYGKLLY